MTGRTPSKSDVSRPLDDGEYTYKKSFYQSADVAADYDFHRLGSSSRQRRHRANWRVIRRALERAGDISSVLDLPGGTGRFSRLVADGGCRVFCADISLDMMLVSARNHRNVTAVGDYVQADAEGLPYCDGAFDCVLSIRFLHHVDGDDRVRILRELGRVSRRWLIVDLRHRYSYHWLRWGMKRLFGRVSRRPPRLTRRQLRTEMAAAGLRIVDVKSVAPIFSDKWIVLAEVSHR